MKKYLILMLFVLASVVGYSTTVLAGYCIVTVETDSGKTSLRHEIETIYNNNAGQDSICTPPGGTPGDADYFDQVIIFATDAWSKNNVKKVVLGKNAALTFANDDKNLVIGNWAPVVVSDTNIDASLDYSQAYIDKINADGTVAGKNVQDYGSIEIDARTNFTAGVVPFVCGASENIYLRHILLKTNNVPLSQLPDCIKNAGDFVVDPGTKEVVCGDDVDNDNDAKTDCDDADCKDDPVCKYVNLKSIEVWSQPKKTPVFWQRRRFFDSKRGQRGR